MRPLNPAGNIIFVDGAETDFIPRPESIILAHPLRIGRQSGLVRPVGGGSDYASTVDVLVNVTTSPQVVMQFPEPVFASYLALAQVEYRKEVRAPSPNVSSSSPPKAAAVRVIVAGRTVANPKWEEHRLILNNWSDWDHAGWPRDKRLAALYALKGLPLPTEARERNRAWEAFRGKCRWLGLKQSEVDDDLLA